MPRPALALAALAFVAGCGMDARMLPWQPLTARTLIAEETVFADGQPFVLRRYAEQRAGMGTVQAVYVLGDDPGRAQPGGGEPTVYSGVVNGRLLFSNFPGEWYCGATQAQCIHELETDLLRRIPDRAGF